MADTVSAQVAGLQLSNNTFTASPPGSMRVARNCTISQKGVLQPRNGQQTLLDTEEQLPLSLGVFQDKLIIYSDTERNGSAGKLGYAGLDPASSSLTAYSGTFNPLFGQGVNDLRFNTANDYLYWCCADGARALEAYNAVPRQAGLLRMPDVLLARLMSTATLVPGFLPNNSAVAYRTVHRKATTNGSSLLSAPSAATIVTNRITIAAGGMVRGGSTVAVTLSNGTQVISQGLIVGDTFSVSPGEANFAAGTYTVATRSGSTFTYTDASSGGSHVSTTLEEINVGPNANLAVIISAAVPPDAVAGDFIRLYRSLNTSTSTVTPGADMFLTNEVVLDGTAISNGVVGISDTTPQSQLFDPLYTNPTIGAGLQESNYPPPLYRDMAVWQGQAWYLNTTGFQELRIQMLGVGATNGVQDGDTLTIDSVVFTFKNIVATSTQVQIFSTGDFASVNIAKTTQSLIQTVNLYFHDHPNSIRLYGDSDLGELGGKVLIQRTDYGASFNVAASRVLTWTPALTAASDNNNAPANLAPSKVGQPEAVAPADEIGQVGSRSYDGLRVLALKQSLIVCKGGDGIFAVTGQPGNYTTRQISTANCIAPNCCAVFSDQAWVYTDQGIIKITDSGGATCINRQLETVMNGLYVQYPAETYETAYAVPYETERRIMFFLPMPNPDLTDTPVLWAYVYSNATQSWTGPYERNEYCGIVALRDDHSHHLVLGGPAQPGNGTDNTINIERKTFTLDDIADEDFGIAITGVSAPTLGAGGTIVTLGAGQLLEVGDGIEQTVAGVLWRTKVIALRDDIDTATYELLELVPFAPGNCRVYRAFEVEAQFLPVGNPGNRKSASSLALFFKPNAFEMALGVATVMTDQIQAEDELPVVSTGYGLGPYGVGSYGNPSKLVNTIQPVHGSDANQYFIGIKTREVWMKMLFEGFSLGFDTAEGPAGR